MPYLSEITLYFEVPVLTLTSSGEPSRTGSGKVSRTSSGELRRVVPGLRPGNPKSFVLADIYTIIEHLIADNRMEHHFD